MKAIKQWFKQRFCKHVYRLDSYLFAPHIATIEGSVMLLCVCVKCEHYHLIAVETPAKITEMLQKRDG